LKAVRSYSSLEHPAHGPSLFVSCSGKCENLAKNFLIRCVDFEEEDSISLAGRSLPLVGRWHDLRYIAAGDVYGVPEAEQCPALEIEFEIEKGETGEHDSCCIIFGLVFAVMGNTPSHLKAM